MTRKEAIRCLYVHSSTNGSGLCTDKQHYEAKQMAIKALSIEPCCNCIEFKRYAKEMGFKIKQEYCEDAISRQEVITQIFYSTDNNGDVVLGSSLRERIARLPSVNPQPKVGHWISVNTGNQSHTKDGMTTESVKCSECDEWLTASDEYACYGRFCPNCGAKMVEP